MSLVTAKRFDLAEYQRLSELGFLKASDHIELIRGEIVYMAAKGVAHEVCITDLNEELIRSLQGAAKVRCQSPIALPPNSSPEPDFAIVRKRLDNYLTGHPKPQDILLVIEVSDSSIAYDQTVKLPLYAEQGIADYWIFNLLDAVLECYSHPYQNPQNNWAYRSKRIFLPTETVELPNMPDSDSLILQNVFPMSP